MTSTLFGDAPIQGYSADTEVLTRRGWLTFDQVSMDDEIATRSPEKRFEWQRARTVTWAPYSGSMIGLHSRSLDILVTPHLQVLWCPDGAAFNRERVGEAWRFTGRAERTPRKRAIGRIPMVSEWDAPDVDEKVFAGIKRAAHGPKPLTIRMTGDQFAAFMGMYAAEGCVVKAENSWGVDICQMAAGKGYEEYRALLTEIVGQEPGRAGEQWRLYSRALYEYFAPFGKALDKWLPREVLDMSRRQLEIFWRYYFLGDGTYEKHVHKRTPDAQVVATASPQMAGQLQEVAQKIGYPCSVRKYKSRANALVRTEGTIYKLRVRTTIYPAFQVVAEAPYAGMVGCVRVANGIIYVRRDGKPAWCGASTRP